MHLSRSRASECMRVHRMHVALTTKERTLSKLRTLPETMVKPLLQVAGTAGVLGELLMMTNHKGNTCLHFAASSRLEKQLVRGEQTLN